jgi:hypothetical protein
MNCGLVPLASSTWHCLLHASKEEQLGVTRFLWVEAVRVVALTHCRLSAKYGDSVLLQQSMY